MLLPKQKLQAQWRIRSNAIRENATQRRAGHEEEEVYIKTADLTEITHLVEIHPEMTDELELNRENRKQLAEMMLEYQTKTNEQEEDPPGQEQRRHYTCIQCKKPPGAPIGKTNRLKRSPEFRQAAQKEEFTNRRQDCRMNFRWPAEIREQRQYICICAQKLSQIQDLENTHQAQANQELEQDKEQMEIEEGTPMMETP